MAGSTSQTSELEEAVATDDISRLLGLLQTQAEADLLVRVHNTLFTAAHLSKDKCIEALATAYPDETRNCVNDTCHKHSGHTPLSLAAFSGTIETLDVLLHYDADVLVCTTQGYPPLEVACTAGSREKAQRLLQKTLASIKESNVAEVTFILYRGLVEAAFKGRAEIVSDFLKVGISVNLNLDDDIGSPLYNAIESGIEECVDVLLVNGADIECLRRSTQQTPLMKAAEVGNTYALKRLLAAGADINRQTDECSSALILACHFGQAESVNILIENGADIKKKNPWNYSALFMGADSLDILKRLVREDLDLNELVGERGEAALHLVTVIGSIPAIKLLLESGADIDLRTKWNETLLWLAAWKGHTEVARFIIQMNCDLDVPSHGCHVWAWEYLPIEVSLGIGHFPIPRMLVYAGCTLRNSLYFTQDEAGPIEELPHVRLRKEVLLLLKSCPTEYEWFRIYVTNANRLMHICRLQIRRYIGSNIFDRVETLPIPKSIKAYLCFTDL